MACRSFPRMGHGEHGNCSRRPLATIARHREREHRSSIQMAGLALLESKRDRIELKSEAKRLRSAMREVVGVVTTLAQSLELVAKTKNYPTWDAACGACSDGTAGVGPASKQLTHGKPMHGRRDDMHGERYGGFPCRTAAIRSSHRRRLSRARPPCWRTVRDAVSSVRCWARRCEGEGGLGGWNRV